MYRAIPSGEDVPNPRSWEWRMGVGTEADEGWELSCYVGKDTLPAARIKMSGELVSHVLLGPDYSVDGEEVGVESRRGSFIEVEEAKSAIEALLKLERSWPHQG